MSEHNQDTTPKARPRRRIKRRLSKTRLPTPPPNPLSESFQQPKTPTEKNVNFFQYVDAVETSPNVLHKSNLDPLFAPVIATNHAFDHLDKLYKLMDQMLNLRQQNARLQKRLCDLQYLKNLRNLHQQYRNPDTLKDLPDLDDDSIFAEAILDTILSGNKRDPKQKSWAKTRFRQSIMKRQRDRSSSLNDNGVSIDSDDIQNRRQSSTLIDRNKSAKVSKWTKVKAAFKWEKASPSVSGAKSQDSGLGIMVPMNYEVARYLRVPSNSDDHAGISTGDSGAAEGSSPGSLSSASSADDIHHSEYHKPISNDIYYKESAKISSGNSSKKRKKLKNLVSRSFDNVFNDELRTEVSDCEEHSHSINSSVLEDSLKSNISKTEIPKDVAKYNPVVADDEAASKQKSTPKRVSKWIKVKKAFLTPTLVHSKNTTNSSRSFGICKEFHFAKTEDESHKVQNEIERDYQELRDRIYQEFDEKYPELRNSISSNLTDSSGTNAGADGGTKEEKNQTYINARFKAQSNKPRESIQMLKENLAPEFKKKLEEWEKFKKHNAKDDLTLVTKTKKKLGEWPKWKSVSSQKQDHNEPQPSTSKSKKLKEQDIRELQWFEKELNNIEKEKQILELERQKFIQREERLAKLRRTVINNGNKKDILIHTPSGFYKFEGISREFTQKLCEWEKAQGIKPEESTFALLSSSFTPNITVDPCESDIRSTERTNSLRLLRSKSAESVAVSNLIEPCSSTVHHPSSLSLNDVEELEKQCFSLSENSSAQDIYSSLDKFQNDEPEAVIVEFEDVVEETAAPLEFLEEKHFPVYQCEKTLSVCDNNFEIAPYVQIVNSNPNNSQYSFYLVEESLALLKNITNDENVECGSLAENFSGIVQHDVGLQTPDLIRLQEINETQIHRANQLIDNLFDLQQMHSKYISDITEEEFISSEIHFHNLLESSQDIFSDLFQMTEHLQTILQNKKFSSSFNFTDCIYSDVIATTSELTSKFSEYKRILTYLFASSDLTAPPQMHPKLDKTSMEYQSTATCSESEDSFEHHQDTLSNKRTRYKKRDYHSKQIMDENEYSDEIYDNKNLSLDENQETTEKNVNSYETLNAKPTTLEKLIIPTKPTTFSENSTSEHDEPVDIFVKTTKKRFAPIIQVETAKFESKSETNLENEEISSKIQELTFRLPPLPSSPISQRKMSKDISPSIRLMLAKYNQLISEHEGNGSIKSAGSSGSASPVAWRSPVSERRVKAQRERYLEVVRKNFNGNEVKKSASASILNTEKKDIPLVSTTDLSKAYESKKVRGILRSTSANAIRITDDNVGVENKSSQLKLFIPQKFEESNIPLPSWRNIQIQKAKEIFFNSTETSAIETTSAPALIDRKKQKAINRYSQVSAGSESSCDSSAYPGALIKSASAGMIHVDEYTYRNIDPALHQDGYVTLPRLAQKEKEGFLGGKLSLSNIASKFRKVRMRKSKDKKKMTTVSTLCRQSLTVDINADNQESVSLKKQIRSDSLTVPENQAASSSDDTSPSSSRSGSWIRRSRIFKAL